jgi:DNA polymerase V
MLQWAGDINAGFPSAAEGYEDQPLDLHRLLIAHPAATFFFWVKGDALRHQHIRDGSILIVDRSVHPRLGKLVLVEIDGSFVVCR